MRTSIFPLRWFTNRQILFWGAIVCAFLVAVPHWLSLVASLPVATLATRLVSPYLAKKAAKDDKETT